MPTCRSVLSFAVAAVTLGFLAGPARAKGPASTAEAAVAKPPLPAIESLQIEPPSLTLENGRDARLVLVWGVTKDGRRYNP